ncbi:MAG: gas vesicle protein GvpC, partial [Tabrizicola sp.]
MIAQAQELLDFHKQLQATTEHFLSETAKARFAQAQK